ncbi:MAG: hypothetical protein A8274_278 [Halanaerobium sp. 4-GBenrich]|nr:MAG: hypothetical protein A8274_278 [Halanaerobium sp. 4-GBenrich]
MIEHIEYTNSDLQNEAIDLIKALGADKSRVWLVEVQNYEGFKRVYGKATADDYFNSKDDFIIYYHESGSIHTHSTFSPDDQEEFEAAAEFIANYLK